MIDNGEVVMDGAAMGVGDWRAFLALYRASFPAAEREPEAALAARLHEGRYALRRALGPERELRGFAMVDHVIQPNYAVLTFLAVGSRWRGRGLGRRLAQAAIARAAHDCLFVEAGPGPDRLYAGLGFRALPIDYRIPDFDSEVGTRPVRLMVHVPGAARRPDGGYVRSVVRHMFRDGYKVAADSSILNNQLNRIPDFLGNDQTAVVAASVDCPDRPHACSSRNATGDS